MVVSIPPARRRPPPPAADAPWSSRSCKAAGVTSVIPLLPFNAFYPVLQAQTQQQYYPHLLLSDYE